MLRVDEIKVLLVTDEPNILEFLEMGLSIEGFKVQVVSDGMTALTLAKQFQPHVAILDVSLPRMGGHEVCCALKELGKIVVIMLAAEEEVNLLAKGLTVKADDYLAKPFDFGELLIRIYKGIGIQFPYLIGKVV